MGWPVSIRIITIVLAVFTVHCGDEDQCTQCPDGCFVLSSDEDHCGSCTNSCGYNQVCEEGYCTSKSGSCPFVFLYDQGKYHYHGDLSGSPLAHGLTFFRPQYYGLNIYSLGAWSADQGRFKMQLRELAFEASFVDHVALALVDVPAGYTVYNEWSSTPQIERTPSLKYVTARDPRPPLSATSDSGKDVLSTIARADGVPLPIENCMSRVVVDFGPVEHPERARLIVTAWGAYADYRDEAEPPYSAGTLIETRDAKGNWQQRVLAGKSAADTKTWAIDIAGVLSTQDGQLRVTMAHQPSTVDALDALLLDDSAPAPQTITRVVPQVARLSLVGASPMHAPTVTSRGRVEEQIIAPIKRALLSGSYTRYGDVRSLIGKVDDHFVVMANGDAIDLEFRAPTQPKGTTRRAFIEADLFYSLKYHPFGLLTDRIEPLPFHGMKSYPYPAEQWPYRDDPEYQSYLRQWNTRNITAPP